MPRGRPSKYTEALAKTICARLMAGESLRRITNDEDMPGETTVYVWLQEKPAFREKYAHAREVQAERWAEEILEIADDGTNDWMAVNAEDDEVYRLNGEHVQRSRLRVDSRKWLMSKLAPKKYSDKHIVAGDPDNPLKVEGIAVNFVGQNPES